MDDRLSAKVTKVRYVDIQNGDHGSEAEAVEASQDYLLRNLLKSSAVNIVFQDGGLSVPVCVLKELDSGGYISINWKKVMKNIE